MGLSFVRTIILYSSVIIAMRIMGKRTIGEMNPTELVVSIMISDLASVPMQSKSTPLFDGIVPIFTLVFLEIVFAFFTMKSRRVRRILVGKSCHVVRKGNFLENEMARLRVTIDDLEEQIRIAGYTDISEVSEIIVETNGHVSIVPKEEVRSVSIKDLNINCEQSVVPYVVVADGQLRSDAAKAAGVDKNLIGKVLHDNSIGSIKDVMYMSGAEGKIIHVQRKNEE